MTAALASSMTSVGLVMIALVAVAGVETLFPLHQKGWWHRRHLGPNLALTAIGFVTNATLNIALVLTLAWLAERRIGVLHRLGLPSLANTVIVIVALDFATYLSHLAMHKSAWLWRFHRVHHADPFVDVTTTIRQHPGESLFRYAALATVSCALGAPVAAFAIYRVWSTLQGLIEHANLRVPAPIDTVLSLLITTPNMHKVHHSRVAARTDTNYGNIFSLFDRLFATMTASKHGIDVAYGLDGFDSPGSQTTRALLLAPFAQATSVHHGSRETSSGTSETPPSKNDTLWKAS